MNKLLVIRVLALLCLCQIQLPAQEWLLPLKKNNAYQQLDNTKGFKQDFNFCGPPVPTTYVNVTAFTEPLDCNADEGEGGSITIEVLNTNGPFDYSINTPLSHSPDESWSFIDSPYNTHTFIDIPAGPYFITIIDGNGYQHSLNFEMSDRAITPVTLNASGFKKAFCNASGSIVKTFFIENPNQKFEIYNAIDDHTNPTIDPVGVFSNEIGAPTTIDLPEGTYYLMTEESNDTSSKCRAYYVFDIEREITNDIPFIEDFSTTLGYPSKQKWSNSNGVFINETYSNNAPSIGMATLDGFNAYGMPYSQVPTGSTGFTNGDADALESLPFCLGDYEPDSLFIRFYYEAQGLGEYPNMGDSLILEFWSPEDVTTIENDSTFIDAIKVTFNNLEGAEPVVFYIPEDDIISQTGNYIYYTHYDTIYQYNSPLVLNNNDGIFSLTIEGNTIEIGSENSGTLLSSGETINFDLLPLYIENGILHAGTNSYSINNETINFNGSSESMQIDGNFITFEVADQVIGLSAINFSVNVEEIYVDLTDESISIEPSAILNVANVNTTVADTVWRKIWEIDGFETAPNNGFKKVDTVITDNRYFYNGFKFRFRNKATITGNNDHWNVDYIQLDINNFPNEFQDVTHVKPISSMINGFQAMPWRHFINGDINALLVNNLYATVHNYFFNNIDITDDRSIKDICLDIALDEVVGPANVEGVSISEGLPTGEHRTIFGMSQVKDSITTLANEAYFADRDSVVFECEWIFSSTNSEINAHNDTLYHYQKFFNYYAYDDETPEKAWGLYGTGAKVAYQFTLAQTDTLRAIQIGFLEMNANVSANEFRLKVWKNIQLESNKDSILYESEVLTTPDYLGGSNNNNFYTYLLDTPLYVEDTIYIGFEQVSDDLLAIGFDQNNDAVQHLFYNTVGEWLPSIYQGALLMRPVVGQALEESTINVGINDVITPTVNTIKLYPNPTNSLLHCSWAANNNSIQQVQVYDFSGKLVLEKQMTNNDVIDVQQLLAGVYLLQAYDTEKHTLSSQKFIKN